MTKLNTANKVLSSFSPAHIERRTGGWYVVWEGRKGTVAKRWMCRGQDFYPVWKKKYPGGGTSCTAISQLIRWLRGQPVLPISTWRRWASDSVMLLPSSAVEELQAGGYPEYAHCVLCERRLDAGLDWWSLDGVSGPCCCYDDGCRQKGKENR